VLAIEHLPDTWTKLTLPAAGSRSLVDRYEEAILAADGAVTRVVRVGQVMRARTTS
jgi:hypothetical protein